MWKFVKNFRVVIINIINFDVKIAKKEQVNIEWDMTFNYDSNSVKIVEMGDDSGR